MPCFYGIFTQSDKYYYIMATKEQKQELSKTLYGTRDINNLSPKQTALIKAIIKDIKQTERKVSRPDNNTATKPFLK